MLAEGQGFEPWLTGPEPVVLPLDDPSVRYDKITDAVIRVKSILSLSFDILVTRHPNRWLCKEAKFKARESRGVRRTSSTPQRQSAAGGKRNPPQAENWTIYEAINEVTRAASVLYTPSPCAAARERVLFR